MKNSPMPNASVTQTVFELARKQCVANTLNALRNGKLESLCSALDESIAVRDAQVAALGSGLPVDIASAIFPGGDPRRVVSPG